MIKINNKKGMFFSLIAIFITIVFMLNFDILSKEEESASYVSATTSRIRTLNNFVTDLDKVYFQRAAYAHAKKAAYALSGYAFTHLLGESYEEMFQQVFLFGYVQDDNGLLGSETICPEYSTKIRDCSIYENKRFVKLYDDPFLDLLSIIEETMLTMRVNVSGLELASFSLNQTNPWEFQVEIAIDFFFQDSDKMASWHGRSVNNAALSIYGLPDPLTNEIINSSWKLDKGDNYWCCSNPSLPLTECVGGGGELQRCKYTEPKFLNRLKGEISASEDGDDNGQGICRPNDNCDVT